MKQDLEKYLKENRLKLDVEEPEADLVWEGIRSGVNKKRQLIPNWFWKVAAILIFVMSGTYFVVNETSKDKMVVITLADISTELGEQEAELQQVVDLKWKQVEPLLPDSNLHLQFLLAEINELDTIYKTYQQDLGQTETNERIIRAMLDYYEKKIRILNRLQLEIEKQKDHENTITL